jgi:hypothetical protein
LLAGNGGEDGILRFAFAVALRTRLLAKALLLGCRSATGILQNFFEGIALIQTPKGMTFIRVFILLAVFAWPALGRAQGDVRTITIESQGAAPSCLEVPQVAAALREDAKLRVIVGTKVPTGGFALRITGTNERFTLLLLSDGQEVAQMFENVACEVATQVVVAFVVSIVDTLGPATAPPSPTPQTAPVLPNGSELAREVNEHLERSGRSMAARGLSLSIVPDVTGQVTGRWLLWIDNQVEGCAAHRVVDEVPNQVRDILIGRMVMAARSIIDTDKTCLDPELLERIDLLARALKPHAKLASRSKLGSGLLAGMGVTLGLVVYDSGPEGKLSTGLAYGTSLIWTAGGVASLVMGDDHQYAGTTASVAGLAGVGVGLGAIAFEGGGRGVDGTVLSNQVHAGPLSAGLALSATAGVLLADRLRHPPTSTARLQSDNRKLAARSKRKELSRQEVAQIEESFRRSSTPTSTWILVSPMLLGAAGNVVGYALEDDDGEADLHLAMGGFLAVEALLLGGLSSVIGTPFSQYQDKLREAGIDVQLAPTPGGLSLSGTF